MCHPLYADNPFLIQAKKAGTSENIFTMSIEELLEIRVASNVNTVLNQQPSSVTVITKNQIRLSGARTLSEAIMLFVPGFFIVEDHDDIVAGFRGFAPDNNSKVMLLINGQNTNTEWFWGPPDAILNSMNYEWVERIEVIRGPGSVIFGQGALLGVINIVTQNGKSLDKDGSKGTFHSHVGMDGYLYEALESKVKKEDFSSYFHVGATKYNGQDLRDEGWPLDATWIGNKGSSIAESDLRLKRSENITAISNLEIKDIVFNFFYADQIRDLYNSQRDRNRFREKLLSLDVGYTFEFSEIFSLDANGMVMRDDFALSSVEGLCAGGTREDRFGGKLVLKAKNFIEGNNFACGFEIRRYEYGKENSDNNNFIINTYNESTLSNLASANEDMTWGYRDDVNVYSLFIEDFHAFNEKITAYAAGRFDKHPNWGSQFTPRIGVLTNPTKNFRIRLSYQAGFRGAPGVHYGGGYRSDGLLRAENFDKIRETNIPMLELYVAGVDENGNPIIQWRIIDGAYEGNIDDTKPEEMHSYELEVGYDLTLEKPVAKTLSFNIVGFYNIIQDIIGVSGFVKNTDESMGDHYDLPNIGSDVPADWNGYWYFQNIPGKIKQWGIEASMMVINDYANITLSHSLVLLREADKGQIRSRYITEDDHFRGYPENVSRLNVFTTPAEKLALSLNYLYYYSWYSPQDKRIDGSHILNIGAAYEIFKGLELSIIAKNLLHEVNRNHSKNDYNLYPVTGFVDYDVTDGVPGLESTTFWAMLKYSF